MNFFANKDFHPAHFQIYPIYSYAVRLYQPPPDQSKVDLWSSVHFYCLSAARHVARKILNARSAQGYLVNEGGYVVALRQTYFPEIGFYLDRGAWFSMIDGARGENLVELYAHINHCIYSDAISAIASEGDISQINVLDNNERAKSWYQEQHPLHRSLWGAYTTQQYPPYSQYRLFYNSSNYPILEAIKWVGADGKTVQVYRSLWRHQRGVETQWAEILPKSPLPLFNLNMITDLPNYRIILVKDEFYVSEPSTHFSGVLFSTIPGGLKNVLTANLEPLRQRPVQVVLDLDDLKYGHRIEHALRKVGVESACFSLSLNDTSRSFETLLALAKTNNIELLPAPASGSLDHGSAVVSAAGEPIPGADADRKMLVHPIICAGYIVWLYAEPKIGKTWLALALAHALERGNCTVGRWRTTEPIGVLYVDGEMLPNEFSESISMVMAGAGDQLGSPSFATMCAQCQPDGLIDITTEKWQQEIEKQLKGKGLLILDNFQSLTDNGAAALNLVRPWLRKLGQIGIAILVLDHTNREGELQGSFAKERFANLTIALRYPDDQAKKEGRVLVEYPRARRLYGADATPFQLQKIFTKDGFRVEVIQYQPSNISTVRPQVYKIAQVVFARDNEHLSYPELHKKFGIAQSTAHGYYQEARTLVGNEKEVFEKELQLLIENKTEAVQK